MKMVKQILAGVMLAMSALALTASGQAQIQITGTPGSAGATTTISGKQLPPPDPKFGGVIKDGALQSKYWWAPHRAAQAGAQYPAHHDRKLRRTVKPNS